MKYIFFILLLFSSSLIAQIDPTSIQKEIDTTLWRSFQEAFESLDAVALNTLYADDVLRVTPDGIDTVNKFKERNLQSFEASRLSGTRIALDFWLDDRKTTEDTSYEVGFYRIGITPKDKETVYNYGQFHIVLKKIDGHWKIVQDWDTETLLGKEITAVDFKRKESWRF